jgi:hypothetical protein
MEFENIVPKGAFFFLNRAIFNISRSLYRSRSKCRIWLVVHAQSEVLNLLKPLLN